MSQLDKLIDICDIAVDESLVPEKSCPPFSVFQGSSIDKPRCCLSSDSADLYHPGTITPNATGEIISQRQDQICPTSLAPLLRLFKAPRAENRLDTCDAYLFHHYISHVAPVLTPVHNCQNPWLRYPAIALYQSFNEGRKHLLHAMMALTAMSLGEANGGRQDLSMLGTKLYSTAMAELRTSIDEQSVDYLGLLTTILTFLFIDVSCTFS